MNPDARAPLPGDHPGPVEAAQEAPPEAAPAAPVERAASAAPVERAVPRPGLPARATPPPPSERPPIELARRVVELAEDKKAADIVLLEVEPLTTIADYLVICSGGSERQLAAIVDGIIEGLEADGAVILGREGQASSHWILLDAGSVIVHVFAPPERDFYALERLWAEARTILRVQ